MRRDITRTAEFLKGLRNVEKHWDVNPNARSYRFIHWSGEMYFRDRKELNDLILFNKGRLKSLLEEKRLC